MTYRLLDCYSGTAFAYAAGQSGFQLAAKCDTAGHPSVAVLEANRSTLGDGTWEHHTDIPLRWPTIAADVVTGAPWSDRSDFIAYAMRARPITIVMGAGVDIYHRRTGQIAELVDMLAKATARPYRTTHVLYREYHPGEPCRRRRYALVATQVGFGVEPPTEAEMPRLERIATPAERGYPATWIIPPGLDTPTLWESAISARAAQWLLTWLSRSLRGRPGRLRGDLLADGSRLINAGQRISQP